MQCATHSSASLGPSRAAWRPLPGGRWRAASRSATGTRRLTASATRGPPASSACARSGGGDGGDDGGDGGA